METRAPLHIPNLRKAKPGRHFPSLFFPMEKEGTYRIVTVCFDKDGNELSPVGVAPVFDTGCPFPTFGIVKPAVTNTRVDMSPYGQSVFADAVDAVQAVDLTFDALINEIDVSKMRVFLSDVLFDREKTGDKAISIPFGKQDCTVFRKVMSTEDTIQEFAPALRTASQSEAFRIALQMLGDLTGFGIGYFGFDESHGYVRTATEVSSDNSALMRNIRRARERS
jgi:A118 family predicted phage portal protein